MRIIKKIIKSISALCVIFSFSCNKENEIDLSNIENLYEQPLHVIQKCVVGKWKWYSQSGGSAGIQYPNSTFVEIHKDLIFMNYSDGIQQTVNFTWKIHAFSNMGIEYTRWVIWETERDQGVWYFEKIKNDTLFVGHVPLPGSTYSQFSSIFSKVK